MWSYHRSKTNIVHLYPPPVHGRVIEPFAGTAKYSLRYWQRQVTLVDRYGDLIAVWKWLQKIRPAELLRLPRSVAPGQRLDDFKFETPEARLLFGFLMSKGNSEPRKTASSWVSQMRPNFINFSLERMAADLHKIRHWDIIHGDYREYSIHGAATWFVDPPYQKLGTSYVYNNKMIDYQELATYVRSLAGQVIVCEGTGANWLPFQPFKEIKSTRSRKVFMELIYYQKDQVPVPFIPKQLTLF